MSMLFYEINWKYLVWNKNDDLVLLTGTSDVEDPWLVFIKYDRSCKPVLV